MSEIELLEVLGRVGQVNERNFQEKDLLRNLYCQCTRACELLRYHRNKSGGRPSNDSLVHMGISLQSTKRITTLFRHSRITSYSNVSLGVWR